MKFLFDFQKIRKIRQARKERIQRTLLPNESVFLKETNRQMEYTFFWRVLTVSTLGIFFFSIIHRFAISAPYYYENFEVVDNTPKDEIIFLEGGFLKKPEVWTEVGDRSDVGGVIDYVVEPIDTISAISDKFGITEQTILQNNDFLDPKSIKPGIVLKIPAADGLVHIVKKGENIGSIAQKYKVEQEKLLAQNQMENDSFLSEGQEIIIPGVKKSAPVKVVKKPSTGTVSAKNVPYARETSGKLLFPTKGTYTQYFHYGHYAVDIAAPLNTPVYASESGTVVRAEASGWNGGYGKVVVIDHGNGMKTLYAHNNAVYVRVGDYVTRGQPIAGMGNTGRVYGRTGIHVHFEVTVHGVKKNPTAYF